MEQNILVLTPRDPHAAPNRGPLLKALRQAAFIGDAFVFEGESHYKPGEAFLSQITFLGCSPVIALGEPGATGDQFCHIAISETSDRPLFLSGINVKPPRCKGCGERLNAWQPLVESWIGNGEKWRCPHCDLASHAHQLKWRQCAGLGRLFIKVYGVFEGEAVPGDKLIQLIEEESHEQWHWFYLRNID